MDLWLLLLVYNLYMFYRILKEDMFVYLWCLIKHILRFAAIFIPSRHTISIFVVVLELKKNKLCFFELYTNGLSFCPLELT